MNRSMSAFAQRTTSDSSDATLRDEDRGVEEPTVQAVFRRIDVQRDLLLGVFVASDGDGRKGLGVEKDPPPLVERQHMDGSAQPMLGLEGAVRAQLGKEGMQIGAEPATDRAGRRWAWRVRGATELALVVS